MHVSYSIYSTVWRIHFRELSSGEIHPLVAQPYMDFSRNEHEIWEFCEIVVHTDMLVVEFSDRLGTEGMKRLAAVVLNWRTGHILLVYTSASLLVSNLTFKALYSSFGRCNY